MSVESMLAILRETQTALTGRERRPFPGERAWLEELARHDECRRERERARVKRELSQRLWAAFMVSPRVEVCEALLRGVDVPAHRLDQEWMR